MFLFLDYYNLSLFLGGVVALASGGFVLLSDTKKPVSIPWMLLNVSTAVWSFGYFVMIVANSHQIALISNWILHFAAILIPVLYLWFITTLTETYGRYKTFLRLLVVPALIFIVVNPTPLFVHDVVPKYVFNYAPDAGPLYFYYTLYFFVIVSFSAFILLREIFGKKTSRDQATRLVYVFLSSLAGFIGGGSVFFLTFNVGLPPYVLVLFTFYPVIIAYAILKHNLFETKIVSTELLTFALWALLLFRALLATDLREQIINFSFFFVTIFFGIFLIRSVVREVESREQIERLALDLEQANEKLKEFDRLKSEFLSMGTHQLRSPLTAIKGYASLIMEGSFGKVPKSIEEAVDRIYQSSRSMANTIEDFLTISRIEQNRMKYDFAVADLGKIVKDVMAELLPNAIKAGLQLTYVDDKRGPYNANVDLGKIRQVIINFLDNAMKYTPKGSITLRVGRNDTTKKILISFVDTGVGMTPETIGKLFQRFSRANDANKTNVMGTGLGLFVAKEMITAHKGGRVWAESEGSGKGSQFYIELDAS